MSELHWFVLHYKSFETSDQRSRYQLLRAYTWQEAHDSLRKDQLKGHVWGIYPLEKNGTFWYDGRQFASVDKEVLCRAGLGWMVGEQTPPYEPLKDHLERIYRDETKEEPPET